MILNWAKQTTAFLIGGSTTTIPTYFIIGSGSGTVVASQVELFNPVDRQAFTSSDLTTLYKIKYTGDWNSIEMSGIQLREVGITISGPALTGSIWSKVNFPSITFDGTNELRIEETWEVF